jgi:hypothetical protein
MKISLRTSGVAAVAGLALASSLLFGASVASAQSVSLSQLVQLFISLGIIDSAHAAAAEAAVANMGTTATTAPSFTYTRNLTVGSTGADVTALQNTLIANSDLAAGLNTGYFGALTQAGVSKWQASAGLPATGFFGPLSMAKLNASAMTTTTTTTTTSTPVTTTTSSTVTNTGVEGILTVNLNPVPSSGQNVYEGDTMDSLLGIKLQAQLSPITIQRVQVDLGNSTSFYTKVFTTLYLVSDTGQTLAQATLNANTVTKQTSGSTNTYYLNFSGFNYTIPGDNSVHVLTVKGDVYGSIDLTTLASTQIPVSIDTNGIRGVDGAGVDQYGPISGSISNSVTVQDSLSDSAQLQISTDSATPLASTVVASAGSNDNEADGVTVLTFDAFAQKDNVTIDDLSGTTTLTVGSHAAPTTAYLYAGANQIGSAAITGLTTGGTTGTFTFQNINYTIPSNTTQALTIKEDIKNADATQVGQTTVVLANGVNAENSVGDTILATGNSPELTGSANGNQLTAIAVGPVFSLVGSPTITTGQTALQNNSSTSTINALFNVNIQAVGGNLYFGTQAASTTFAIAPYVNGVVTASSTFAVAATSWNIPSSGVVTTGLPGASVAFELQQNNSIQIPVNFLLYGRNSAGSLVAAGSYAVGLNGINWSTNGTVNNSSTFMAGQLNWRTSSVSFP